MCNICLSIWAYHAPLTCTPTLLGARWPANSLMPCHTTIMACMHACCTRIQAAYAQGRTMDSVTVTGDAC
jgi:hypothetical protein